jgi:hypothetical protein
MPVTSPASNKLFYFNLRSEAHTYFLVGDDNSGFIFCGVDGYKPIDNITKNVRVTRKVVTRLHVYIVARMAKGFDACFMHVLKQLRAINNQNHWCVVSIGNSMAAVDKISVLSSHGFLTISFVDSIPSIQGIGLVCIRTTRVQLSIATARHSPSLEAHYELL